MKGSSSWWSSLWWWWWSSARLCRPRRSQPLIRGRPHRRTTPSPCARQISCATPISSGAAFGTPDQVVRNALTEYENSAPPGQLGTYQWSDFLRHIRMPGVVGMDPVRADQVGPTDEPALADRVDECCPRPIGLAVEGVADVQDVERRIGGRPGWADHQQLRRRRDAARQIESVVCHARHLHSVDALVVAGAEEHHQRIVGVDCSASQIFKNAAVIAAHDIAGP